MLLHLELKSVPDSRSRVCTVWFCFVYSLTYLVFYLFSSEATDGYSGYSLQIHRPVAPCALKLSSTASLDGWTEGTLFLDKVGAHFSLWTNLLHRLLVQLVKAIASTGGSGSRSWKDHRLVIGFFELVGAIWYVFFAVSEVWRVDFAFFPMFELWLAASFVHSATIFIYFGLEIIVLLNYLCFFFLFEPD